MDITEEDLAPAAQQFASGNAKEGIELLAGVTGGTVGGPLGAALGAGGTKLAFQLLGEKPTDRMLALDAKLDEQDEQARAIAQYLLKGIQVLHDAKLDEFFELVEAREQDKVALVKALDGQRELLLKIWEGLGELLRRHPDLQALGPMSADRKQRVLRQLQSDDRSERLRALDKLHGGYDGELVAMLEQWVRGADEEESQAALSVLMQIPGRMSAEVIAIGLTHASTRVESFAAYALGEIALRGRRQDSNLVVRKLIDKLGAPDTEEPIRRELIHSISKIGGDRPFRALVEVLTSDEGTAGMKASALHGPTRFWKPGASGQSEADPVGRLYSRFVREAKGAIQGWSPELCKLVSQDEDHFKWIDDAAIVDEVMDRSRT